MRNILKNKKYLDCPHLKHTLHFFYDEIRSCCANVKGITFQKIDENHKLNKNIIEKMYAKRKSVVKKINSFLTDENFPSQCDNCTYKNDFISSYKIADFDNSIDELYIQHFMGCNARCTYCSFEYIRNKEMVYEVFPILQKLINNKILSKCASVFMSGGEPTISPEFENLFMCLSEYLETKIEVFTSCIKYSAAIEKAFVKNKVKLLISLDSASPQIYKKIKQVDAFDNVISNLKRYISVSENAKSNIILKYILIDDVNDDINEIFSFLDLVSSLGIKTVMFSFDCVKYRYDLDKQIPLYYFEIYNKFQKYAENLGLFVDINVQAEAIMKKYNNFDF